MSEPGIEERPTPSAQGTPNGQGERVLDKGGQEVTELLLEVGTQKLRQFERKPQIAAIAELVWNALDANATSVRVELHRTSWQALDQILVIDNGDGITPGRARRSFKEYGDTWKARRTHTDGNLRILHGRKGEGRLFAFALGEDLKWDSIAIVDGRPIGTRITANAQKPTLWRVEETVAAHDKSGTIVTVRVPQEKRLRSLERTDAAANLTAKLAFYLKSYSDVTVEYDGMTLDVDALISNVEDLALDLPAEYIRDAPPPFVTFVEWEERMGDRKMLVCNAAGMALAEYGEERKDPIVAFTPYLRSARFDKMPIEDIYALPMTHAALLDSAEKAIRKHLSRRHREISSQVIGQLKDEGLYPYDERATAPTEVVERQTFDLVVTVARSALPLKGPARELSVKLIQTALERSPGTLHAILDRVLSLAPEEQEHLSHLLSRTDLPEVISAATTVTNRLDFIGGLRKIFANTQLRRSFREVDQLHPMISQNLWLFGEEWTISRPEVGLTSVLASHLGMLGDDVVLEGNISPVRRADGRTGRVDILLYRGIGDERHNERLIVELKRPSVEVGPEELEQIKSYARAIVDDPQFRGVACKWKFVLVTYEYDPKIERDIKQRNKPPGLADDQEEYEVWVRTWGDMLDSAERKLKFFRDQLDYEATDERVTQYLRDSYEKYIPDNLRAAPTPDAGDE